MLHMINIFDASVNNLPPPLPSMSDAPRFFRFRDFLDVSTSNLRRNILQYLD